MFTGRLVTDIIDIWTASIEHLPCYLLVIFTDSVGRLLTSDILIKWGMELIAILREETK